MDAAIYNSIPDCAKEVRQKVFINEQGFQNEFDDIDDTAIHLVLFDNKIPIATCRIFYDTAMNSYILGRLAVIKEYRGKNIGSFIMNQAEQYIQKQGGQHISLHAQCKAAAFYKKLGFTEFGPIENDEDCPHIWMQKSL